LMWQASKAVHRASSMTYNIFSKSRSEVHDCTKGN
jgi:hypothetical protein